MNSRLYIPALITLGLGILSGCGGSSSSEQAYLPIGLQRTLDITLPNGQPYVFSFIIASESTATIYTGTSPAASTASIHVVNYKPSSDSAEQIGFYWSSNDGETTNNLNRGLWKCCRDYTGRQGRSDCWLFPRHWTTSKSLFVPQNRRKACS